MTLSTPGSRVKEAVRACLASRLVVTREAAWRQVTGAFDARSQELELYVVAEECTTLRGKSPEELVDELAELPVSLLRHFGLRRRDASPGRASEAAPGAKYGRLFLQSEQVKSLLGPTKVVAPTVPVEGKKLFFEKFVDHMEHQGGSTVGPPTGGRKHYDVPDRIAQVVRDDDLEERPAVLDERAADLEDKEMKRLAVESPLRQDALRSREAAVREEAAWASFAQALHPPPRPHSPLRAPARVARR